MATIALGLLGTVGSLASASAQAAAARANAANAANIANYNAQIAENNARYEIQLAAQNASRQRVQNARDIGRAQAQYGSSGLDLGSGSVNDVLLEMINEGEILGAQREHEGVVRATSLRNEAALFRYSARAQLDAGNATARSITSGAGLKAATSLFSQFSSGFSTSKPSNFSIGFGGGTGLSGGFFPA